MGVFLLRNTEGLEEFYAPANGIEHKESQGEKKELLVKLYGLRQVCSNGQ